MADENSLFEEEGLAPTTTEEISPAAPAVERDEAGRFKPRGEAVDLIAEGAPPAPETEKTRDIPLTALLDEREKRQNSERQAADYKRQLEALQRPQQAPQIPDAIEDQEGFAAYLMQQQRVQIDNLEAQFSERMARKDYGTEAVDAALNAAREQGVLAHFTRGPDRWERMCEWHKQAQAAAEIGGDPTAYRAKVEAEIRAKIEAEYGVKPRPAGSSPAIPPSLASAASSGQPETKPKEHPLFS